MKKNLLAGMIPGFEVEVAIISLAAIFLLRRRL
ncbi:PGF-CTERM sorting domain-containing protein [Methanolobus sp.]|jgi:hypothetical protein